MRILGIETSCDETAVAVVDVTGPAKRPRVRVLSNIIASQVKLHAQFGGVVPNLAKREHQKNLVPILLRALAEAGPLRAKIKKKNAKLQIKIQKSKAQTLDSRFQILASILEREPDLLQRVKRQVLRMAPPAIDAIAATVGPGLAPALWVGVNFARAISYLWAKPLIPVNHLEGHIYTNLLRQIREVKSPRTRTSSVRGKQKSKVKSTRYPITYPLTFFTFPALALIVSGGHTELVFMRRYGDYRVIGETRDDAVGEAFDKVAKMLGLGFPGGPIISRLAKSGDPQAFTFPRPMLSSANFDFSFSGLKTAVLYTLRDLKRLPWRMKRDIAASFEQAAVDVLVAKTVRAAREHGVRTVLIGGGVAANTKLRAALGAALQRSLPRTHYLTPDVSLTGDNALMIALAGWFSRAGKQRWRSLRADANLRLDA